MLNQIGLRGKDALHISCAISAGCQYFLTTDDKILNINGLIEAITIIDPIGFIREVP
jgi:predicted nucleic acid-binding protein